jgi:hypothetical protein
MPDNSFSPAFATFYRSPTTYILQLFLSTLQPKVAGSFNGGLPDFTYDFVPLLRELSEILKVAP